jgi:hypothetical protein
MSLILSGTDGLSDVDGSAATPAIRGTDANTGIFFPAADTIAFSEGGVEAMRIDSSGNVGIGTNSPGAKLEVNGNIRLNGGSNTLYTTSADLIFQSGSSGLIRFANNDGANERARIDSSGNLLVGITSSAGYASHMTVKNATDVNSFVTLNQAASNPYGQFIGFTAAAPNDTTRYFLLCADNAATRAIIRSNGGIANFSANNVNLSDRREKTNFAPAKSYLETICAIPVQTFNYIDQNQEEDPGLTLGVVAQDVQEVAPELVMESNWGTKDEPKMRLSIYQTDLQYALMKCIQEQQAIITSLTDRITALEAK